MLVNGKQKSTSPREVASTDDWYFQLYQAAPVAMIAWDVTQLREYLNELACDCTELKSRLEQDLHQLHHCWSLVENIGQNQAFVKMMGLDSLDVPEDGFHDFESQTYRKVVVDVIMAIAEDKDVDERELLLVTANGEDKYILAKSLVLSEGDVCERVLVALTDISERKRSEEALRKSESRFKELSFKDNLTGLYNRRYLYGSLTDLIENNAYGNNISLIFLDLDHFKTVVDTYGHLNGSRAIREVAKTIHSCLAEPEFGVAYAGDEFVVVLPGYGRDKALAKALEIRLAMKESRYNLEEEVTITLSASFGIATLPNDAEDSESLLSAADKALFAVKEDGKNGIRQFADLK